MKGVRVLSLVAMCLCSIPLICGCTALEPQQEKNVPESASVSPVFDIPKMDKITVDGDASDWADGGFRIDLMANASGVAKDPAHFNVRFRLGWDQRGLLILIHGYDKDFSEGETENELWRKDCVEMFMLDKRGGEELVQAVIAPGMDPEHPEVRYALYDRRNDEALKKTKPTITVARKKLDDNHYVMEVLLPWENVGLQPQLGAELGLQLYADDHAEGQSQFHALWYPSSNPTRNRSHTHRIRLAEKASPTVSSATRVYYEGAQNTRVVLTCTAETVGETVSVLADGKEIARSALNRGESLCNADLHIPFPAVDSGWSTLDIQIDGKTIDTLTLPNSQKARAEGGKRLAFSFDSYCFTGSRFPDADFDNRAEAQNAIGPYTINITYYDAEYNLVTSAEKPGRYAAIVEITPTNGPVIKRMCTLFRILGDINWRDLSTQALTEPSQRYGSDSDLIHKGKYVPPSERIEKILARELVHSEYGALLLAWNEDVAPGTPPTALTSPETCNTRWLYKLKCKIGDVAPIKHYVHLPEGVEENPEKKWPTILFLHGGGWGAELLPENPIVQYAQEHEGFPFIVIAPLCPRGNRWGGIAPNISDLLDELITKYPIDPNRLYVTGLSMGGGGSWRLATEFPERFAAAIPICGYGDTGDAERIKDMPIWFFHAINDEVVPVERSQEMTAALEKLGGRVRLTLNETEGHSVWRVVYKMDEVYSWLLEQSLGNPSQPQYTAPDTTPDTTPNATPEATE